MEQGEGEQRVTISVFLRTVCNHIGAASMKDRILRLHFCCLKDRMQLKKKDHCCFFRRLFAIILVLIFQMTISQDYTPAFERLSVVFKKKP